MGFTKMNSKDVCRHLFETASFLLARDGNLTPFAFLFTENVCFAIPAMHFLKDSNAKDQLSFLLRKAAGEETILGIAIVMEGWMRPATEKEKRTGMKEDNRPVSEHPDKKEIISVQCEWHDNTQYMLTAVFNRKQEENGKESITIEASEGSQTFEGRFANLFPPTRSGGYVH
jgi:hypothetical protein